jgi:hypothetical protein
MRTLMAALLLGCVATAGMPAIAEAKRVWEGGFWGGRDVEEPALIRRRSSNGEIDWEMGDRTRIDWRREHRFFASKKSCEAWLYKMRSTWQDWPRYSWCRSAVVQG